MRIYPTDGVSGIISPPYSFYWYEDWFWSPRNNRAMGATVKKVVVENGVSITGSNNGMFGHLPNCIEMDLRGLDTSRCTSFSRFFEGDYALQFLDISTWDTTHIPSGDRWGYYSFFAGVQSLKKIVIGSDFSFAGSAWSLLYFPTPSGVNYTGKWIREDKAYGPFTPAELRDNYTSEMAGTWVWEMMPPAAYAILQDNGELVLFRADAGLTAGTGKTVTDVSGNTYTGQLYTGIETTNFNNSSNCKWIDQRSSIKSVRVAEGQVIKPISCLDWFYGCSNMTSCDLKGLDTSNVTSMSEMFSGCSSLISLDLSGFDTSNVINMEQMFYKTPYACIEFIKF